MCGIVGIFDITGLRDVGSDVLARMNDSQLHRGPDEMGVHIEPGLGLGHRRLSIIDLSTGQQPLFNEDGSVVVVYNGEIYNFLELTESLKRLGHRFRTHSDTEVIVHAWEEWGEHCVQRFRGMFAFVLWDKNSQTLFLARDRLGIKPLYYAHLPNEQFAFASELKGLLAHPQLPRELDDTAVEDYFAYGYIPEPKTILRQAFKLPPGHTLTLNRNRRFGTPRRYWDVSFKPLGPISEQDIEHEFVERLREAVGIRLMAEVPLGAFLSGGVDSSAVVAMMASSLNGPVNTCSISFGNPRYDEAEYAARVAARYRTNHYVEQVEADDFALIDKLAMVYDEPYADSSAIPTYRVCEIARKRVTVALSGDGGDENFAGYGRYRWHLYEERVRSLLPQSICRPLFSFLSMAYPQVDWAPKIFRLKSTFEALTRNTLEAYFHSISVVPDAVRHRLFSASLQRALQGYRAIDVLHHHASRAPTDHPLSRVQYLDIKTYLPGDILTKVDRASMAHSLEVRIPILDHKLVEWLSGLPPTLKLKGRATKFVFKRALGPHLPSDVLYRPKMGFAVPLASWFRGPLRERVQATVLGSNLADTGFFNPAALTELVQQHQSGAADHSPALWSLLMYEAFNRQILGST